MSHVTMRERLTLWAPDRIKDLRDWMNRINLQLNVDKTEFLLIGTKHQLEKVNFSSITVSDTLIETKPEVRNL